MNKGKVANIIAFGTFMAVILMMMAATVLERISGSDMALKWVYHNPLFFALWGVICLLGICLLVSRETGKNPWTLLLHISFVLILAGALTTHLTGEDGSVRLPRGEEVSQWERSDGTLSPLPRPMTLEEFQIQYYPGSNAPSDYRSTILVQGERQVISMNHIAKIDGYRFYQADYDDEASILAVSHDPWGIGITYTAYILLLLSMVGFFFQRNTIFRKSLKQVAQPSDRPFPRKLAKYSACLAWLLFAGLTLTIGLKWSDGYSPFVGSFSVMMLMAWFSSLGMCLLWKRFPLILPLGFLLSGFTILVAFLSGAGPKDHLMPVLRSPLLSIHVLSMMLSYTLLGLIALNGIIGLLVSKKMAVRLRNVGLVFLYPAVFVLIFGTFIGAVWANISWGNYWAWDPKETWALVTFLVYSFALHGNLLKPFRNPRFFHAFCIIAFICVLITYFGVNLILGGVHAYN